jgi:hypothetical protein
MQKLNWQEVLPEVVIEEIRGRRAVKQLQEWIAAMTDGYEPGRTTIYDSYQNPETSGNRLIIREARNLLQRLDFKAEKKQASLLSPESPIGIRIPGQIGEYLIPQQAAF